MILQRDLSSAHEDILNMKQFIKDNGVGNSRSADALTRFYETFMR